MTTILDGRSVAAALREELRADVAQFTEATGAPPQIVVVQVEGDAASAWYVRAISRACQQVGIQFQLTQLPASVDQQTVLDVMRELNEQPAIHGIILQVPLPKQLDADAIIAALDPRKDVDGLHPLSLGRLAQGLPAL